MKLLWCIITDFIFGSLARAGVVKVGGAWSCGALFLAGLNGKNLRFAQRENGHGSGTEMARKMPFPASFRKVGVQLRVQGGS